MKTLKISVTLFLITYIKFHSLIAQNQIDSSNYDCQTVTQIINTDTLIKKICTERKSIIFKQGKNYIYRATIVDKNDTINQSEVTFMGTNKRSEFAPQSQMLINMTFERFEKDSILLHKLSNNKTCCPWRNSQSEGIIENVSRVWIHPIRSNQFILTEIAGFPDVRLPLEIDNNWSSTLNITGWGEWKNLILINNYKVLSKKKYILENQVLDCWEIVCKTNVKDETNTHTFLFHENYGFVQMKYEYSNGTKIIFDMTKCIMEDEKNKK